MSIKISRKMLNTALASGKIDQVTFDKLDASGLVSSQFRVHSYRVMTDNQNQTVYLKGFNFGIKKDGKDTRKNSIRLHWGKEMKQCESEMIEVYEKYSTEESTKIKNN
jgi:hypothetical protein